MAKAKPPRCPEDYADAAKRHWHDADSLETASRLAAADHHVGIAAECAVKHAIASSYGQGLAGTPRMHIDKLWGQATQMVDPAAFPQLHATLMGNSPFVHWSVEDRYANSAFISSDIEFDDGFGPRRDVRRQTVKLMLQQAGLST